jgi:creatinine amidohydrolase
MHNRTSESGASTIRLLTLAGLAVVLAVMLRSRCSTCVPAPSVPPASSQYLPDGHPSPIEPIGSLQLKELTWVEVRDRLASGTRRVIVPTGGIEQNGPYVALNKHDVIVGEISSRAAQILGNTLVAPTISFVPEGQISPPSGHMLFPGTLSVNPATFENLIIDVVASLVAHGFTDICIIGDSGGSQHGMEQAAVRAQRQVGPDSKIRFIREYYDYDAVRALIRKSGINELPDYPKG